MDIIFSREAADGLRDRFTVLELETFNVEGKVLETFCVIPADRLIMEMGQLEDNIKMHEQLVQGIKDQRDDVVLGFIEVLHGKFGGELDSFYDVMRDRFKPSI